MPKKLHLIPVALFAVTLSGAAFAQPNCPAMRKINIGVSVAPPNVVHTSPYVAKALGYFEKRCIDANIVQFEGGQSQTSAVAAAQGSAIVSVSDVSIGRGLKVQQIWALAPRMPQAYMVPGDIKALSKMADPKRYVDPEFMRKNFEALYGGEMTGAEMMAQMQTPYSPNLIYRNSNWIWHAGTPVHLIREPNGAVWVMQEYTKDVDPSLTLDNLHQVGSKLKGLPKGWVFETKVLTKELSLNTSRCDGWAAIIRDELHCTYQGCGYGADSSANFVP